MSLCASSVFTAVAFHSSLGARDSSPPPQLRSFFIGSDLPVEDVKDVQDSTFGSCPVPIASQVTAREVSWADIW